MNRLAPLEQELMTPQEAARWFRRSISWLRQQRELLRLGRTGQPLYHVDVCRAFVYGQIRGLNVQQLRRVQLEALAASCHLQDARGAGARGGTPPGRPEQAERPEPGDRPFMRTRPPESPRGSTRRFRRSRVR